MTRPSHTLKIRHSHGVRSIPYNWKPSRSEAIDAIRRLTEQIPRTEIKSVLVIEHILVDEYDVGQAKLAQQQFPHPWLTK